MAASMAELGGCATILWVGLTVNTPGCYDAGRAGIASIGWARAGGLGDARGNLNSDLWIYHPELV